jgi:hypothetical protein
MSDGRWRLRPEGIKGSLQLNRVSKPVRRGTVSAGTEEG